MSEFFSARSFATLSATVFALVAGGSMLISSPQSSDRAASAHAQVTSTFHVATANVRPDQADSFHSYPC